ncbi:MAG: hypothetical protein GEU82_10055 [Luteitalea sp.]|nr:hypothetical protein [Luteitalea sp.]
MQQRQLRLGDILDDYCPRERRVTNHAVVAMVGLDVKQTRCTTCDAEHDYKHAKVPRQRKKSDSPALLYAQVLAGGPKKVTHDPPGAVAAAVPVADEPDERDEQDERPVGSAPAPVHEMTTAPAHREALVDEDDRVGQKPHEDGPVHRRLIRAQLPRIEGQPPPARQAPDFTIRQPAGRVNRFRPRHQRGGGDPFQGPGSRPNNGNMTGGPMRGGSQSPQGSQRSPGHNSGGRPPMMSRLAKRQGPGRKRSK